MGKMIISVCAQTHVRTTTSHTNTHTKVEKRRGGMSCQRLEAFQSRGLEMKKKEKDKQNLASF
jgi:hypothetical protein